VTAIPPNVAFGYLAAWMLIALTALTFNHRKRTTSSPT
jgi:hypothetical protein